MLQQALYMLAFCEFMLPLCGNLQIAAWSPIGSASACMAQMPLSNIMVIKARSLLHSCICYKVRLGQKLATSSASCTAQASTSCELKTFLLCCGQLHMMTSASLWTETDDAHDPSQQRALLPAESCIR